MRRSECFSRKWKRTNKIQRKTIGEQEYLISYDIEEIDKRNEFLKGLKPNNSQYTQPQKKLDLTPERLAHRKEIVERLLSDYRKMEHTEWYESRTQKEETDMQRIANIINKNRILQVDDGKERSK